MEISRPLGASIVLAALLGVAGLALAGAWADLSSTQDELQARTDFVPGRIEAARRGDGQASAEAPTRLFVEAGSETLAAAELDALVRSTTAEAGGSVLSSRAEAKHDEGGIAGRIEIVAEIEGQNDVLQAILLKLETGSPWLGVESLAIQPELAGTGTADPAPRLRADVTFAAYWLAAKR